MKKNLDELLRTACAAQNDAEIAAAGLRPARRARKPLRVAIAAAACAALLTTGVAAVWPQLQLQRTGANSFDVHVDGASRSASTEVAPIELGYLPAGYTVEYGTTVDGINGQTAEVTDPNGDVLSIARYPLSTAATIQVFDENMQPVGPDDPAFQQIYDSVNLVDSFSEVTTDLLAEFGTVTAWPDSDCYYTVSMSCHENENRVLEGMDLNEAMKILQNIQ